MSKCPPTETLCRECESGDIRTGNNPLTKSDIARKLGVSTKTVDRWREGNMLEYSRDSNGRVLFDESSICDFLKRYPERVHKASQFTRISEEERRHIFELAHSIMQSCRNPKFSDIVRRIAEETGRSFESIRYTLRNHEKASGISMYPRDGRVSRRTRTERAMSVKIKYIYNEEFESENADALILAPEPDVGNTHAKRSPGAAELYPSSINTPLLTREQEKYFFRKMNYLLYKAGKLQEKWNGDNPTINELTEFEQLLDEASRVRRHLISSNLRLVVAYTKKHKPRAGWNDLCELESDGNVTLISAINNFDYGRGNKFSTYATCALMKNMSRPQGKKNREISNVSSSFLDVLTTAKDDKPEFVTKELREKLSKLFAVHMKGLSTRERKILSLRYGLDGGKPMTLNEIGKDFGITKERVRQIETRALKKLRTSMNPEKVLQYI